MRIWFLVSVFAATSCGAIDVDKPDAGAGGAASGSATAQSTAVGTGGGGAPDSGSDGSTCFAPCGYPVGAAIDCDPIGEQLDGGCIMVSSDGLPCWRGVGTCAGGTCVPPAGQCDQPPPGPAWVACANDNDCDDGNPCTEGDCPEPGCLACHQAPLPDGTPCGTGKACREGACCSPL